MAAMSFHIVAGSSVAGSKLSRLRSPGLTRFENSPLIYREDVMPTVRKKHLDQPAGSYSLNMEA